MTQYVRVAEIGAVAPGQGRAFDVGRYEVALFNVDGELHAIENSCPHQGGPLAEGWMEGPTVTCPWHGWCFDVRTGKMTLGEFARVARFAVKCEDGAVWIGTEPEPEI